LLKQASKWFSSRRLTITIASDAEVKTTAGIAASTIKTKGKTHAASAKDKATYLSAAVSEKSESRREKIRRSTETPA